MPNGPLGRRVLGIEAERANAVNEIGFLDRFLGLDRVHEAQGRLGQGAARHAHLADRRDVVMRHTAVPEDLEQFGGGVRLDGIEHRSRKLLDKEAGGARGARQACQA